MVAAAVLPYVATLGYGFVFDDEYLVVRNSFLREPWSVLRAFAHPFWHGTGFGDIYYRPVVVASLALNGKLAGWGPAGFHLMNVLLHAVSAALLLLLCRRLGFGLAPSFLAALGFALHPAAAWPVGSVVARVDLLPALFVLLAWIALASGGARPPGGMGRMLRGVGCGVAVLLALLSKESALAFVVLLALGSRRRRAGAGGGWSPAALLGMGALPVAAAVLLRVASGAGLSYGAEAIDPIANPLVDLPAGGRVAAALELLGRYLACLGWSAPLTDPHGYAPGFPPPAWSHPPVLAGALLPVLWAAACAVLWARGDRAVAPLAFLVGSLLPASNLAVPIAALYAQNFLYLPLVGACVLMADLLDQGARRLPRRILAPATAVLAAGMALLGARSSREAAIWRGETALFTAWAERFPLYSLAHGRLGLARLRGGRMREAVEPLERAVSLDPRNGEAHYNLGVALLATGGTGEAEAALRHSRLAAEHLGGFPPARVNAAQALLRLGRPEAALAARRDLPLGAARFDFLLARVAAAGGNWDEARAHLQAALRGDPAAGDWLAAAEDLAPIRGAAAPR